MGMFTEMLGAVAESAFNTLKDKVENAADNALAAKVLSNDKELAIKIKRYFDDFSATKKVVLFHKEDNGYSSFSFSNGKEFISGYEEDVRRWSEEMEHKSEKDWHVPMLYILNYSSLDFSAATIAYYIVNKQKFWHLGRLIGKFGILGKITAVDYRIFSELSNIGFAHSSEVFDFFKEIAYYNSKISELIIETSRWKCCGECSLQELTTIVENPKILVEKNLCTNEQLHEAFYSYSLDNYINFWTGMLNIDGCNFFRWNPHTKFDYYAGNFSRRGFCEDVHFLALSLLVYFKKNGQSWSEMDAMAKRFRSFATFAEFATNYADFTESYADFTEFATDYNYADFTEFATNYQEQIMSDLNYLLEINFEKKTNSVDFFKWFTKFHYEDPEHPLDEQTKKFLELMHERYGTPTLEEDMRLTGFDVVIEKVDESKKDELVMKLMESKNLDFAAAIKIVENLPYVFEENLEQDAANELQENLEQLGGKCRLKNEKLENARSRLKEEEDAENRQKKEAQLAEKNISIVLKKVEFDDNSQKADFMRTLKEVLSCDLAKVNAFIENAPIIIKTDIDFETAQSINEKIKNMEILNSHDVLRWLADGKLNMSVDVLLESLDEKNKMPIAAELKKHLNIGLKDGIEIIDGVLNSGKPQTIAKNVQSATAAKLKKALEKLNATLAFTYSEENQGRKK